MNRKCIFVLFFVLLWAILFTPALFARPMSEYSSGGRTAGTASAGTGPATTAQPDGSPRRTSRLPRNLLDNDHYRESIRLTKLAQETYDYGDYDLAREHAEEAQRQARLSDEYIARQLKIAETDDAIEAAGQRIDWALSVKADRRYPREFAVAAASRDNAVSYRDAENWDAAIVAAHQAIEALALVESIPGILLPAQYQVRPWSVSRDCFWNIAGRSWAYGDNRLWPRLYDANRTKLPDPNNADLILPGIILDIPSIKGEEREGLWNENTEYPSFN